VRNFTAKIMGIIFVVSFSNINVRENKLENLG
jgi:hypothetical protein